jgi:hypothetical protein
MTPGERVASGEAKAGVVRERRVVRSEAEVYILMFVVVG